MSVVDPNASPLVLGLVGATGSGKTTVARALASTHGFENFHMGRPLKDMLRALGLSEEAVAGSPEERSAHGLRRRPFQAEYSGHMRQVLEEMSPLASKSLPPVSGEKKRGPSALSAFFNTISQSQPAANRGATGFGGPAGLPG